MDRPIGSKAKLNNKDVVWSGSEYGWQSPASHLKLRNQGQFAIGRRELDAVGRFIAPGLQKIRDFQQGVRQATPWLDPVENNVNRLVRADDRLPSSRVAQGGAIAAQRAAQAVNVDQRIGAILPLLIGAVHTSGPRAGTTKLNPRRDIPIPHNQLEDSVEQAYLHINRTGGLRGYDKRVGDLPNGSSVEIYNRGNVDFPNRNGLTLKIKPPTNGQVAKAAAVGQPIPQPTVKVEPPKVVKPLKINKVLPDLQQRFEPQVTAKSTDRQLGDATLRDPRLRRDLPPPSTSPQGLSAPVNKQDAQLAAERANAVLPEGDVPWKVAFLESHHEAPLKDSINFVEGWDDRSVAQFREAMANEGLHLGDTQLNATYLRKPFHTGNKDWPITMKSAAHRRLINSNYEAASQPGDIRSRWEFIKNLPVEVQKLAIPTFIDDAKANQRVAREVDFLQTQLESGVGEAATMVNPYGGTFSQSVLAPPDKAKLQIIKQARRQARESLRIK